MNASTIFHNIQQIKQSNPVIHNVTNYVVMQTTANILLALGASPIMAHAPEELAEIIKLAKALVVNIGTLDENWIHSIATAQKAALNAKIPIILDPVGAGATQYRTRIARAILEQGVTILRGNASEIMALVDSKMQSKGVDAQHSSETAVEAAKQLAARYHCVVVISGETDYIVHQNQVAAVHHGTPLFTHVTGMGCSVSAVIAAFAAMNADYFAAAFHAMAAFGIAGEIAAQKSTGPGSFYIALVDTLFFLTEKDLQRLKLN